MWPRAQRLFLFSAARVLRALSRITIHRCLVFLRTTFSGGLVLGEVKRMASSSSALQRVLDSPFSHKELYGTSHPSAVKKKGKRRRARRASTCRSSSVPVDPSWKTRRKAAPNGRTDGVASTTATCRATPKTPSLSLPAVDYDSPKVKSRQRSTMASKSEVNPAKVASTLTVGPNVGSGLSSRNLRRSTLDNHLPAKLDPLQTCSCQHVDKLSLNGQLARGLSTTALHSSGGVSGQSLPAVRRWWLQRDFSHGLGVHSQCMTLEDLARGLSRGQYEKIVVMSGAGISTSSGIPDFRTPGTGLYDNLQQYKIPEPSAIFDITFFFHNPKPFFTLAKELYPGNYAPNAVHYFVRLLQDKGLLLRNYTQNIDGLERIAGVKPFKLVEAHGSFLSASCTLCHTKHDPQHIKELIFSDRIPKCKQRFCSGVVKPDIVFFGEDLPSKFHMMKMTDFSQCDLLLVLGTSLEVEPFASLATMTRFDVPRILINREAVGVFRHRRRRTKDMSLIGDLVSQIWELVRVTGWKLELEKLIPSSMKHSSAEENEARHDRTTEESRHPGSSVDDACNSNDEQDHPRRVPQQEKKGPESPSVNPDSDSTLEHVRQTFDKFHIMKTSSDTVDEDDAR